MGFEDWSASLKASLLVVAICAGLGVAVATRIPRSLVLFAGGVAAAIALGSPRDAIDPKLVLSLVLPLLLYSAASRLSLETVRRALVPGVVIGLLSMAAMIVVSAGVVSRLDPALGWATVSYLAVLPIIADTRLIDELGRSKDLPAVVADTLTAQGLAAPILFLSLILMIEDYLGAAPPGWDQLAGKLALDWGGGLMIGLAAGLVIVQARRLIDVATIEIAMSLATPYLIVAICEIISASVIVPMITAGMLVAHFSIDKATGRTLSDVDGRLIARHFWREIDVLMAGLLFFLSGFLLPGALAGLAPTAQYQPVAIAAALMLTVVVIQGAQAVLATALSPRRRPPSARSFLQHAMLVAYVPNRAGLALLTAMAIPTSLPDGGRFADRDVILVITVILVISSFVVTWLSLPWMLEPERARAEAERRAEAAEAEAILHGVDARDEQAVAAARVEIERGRRAARLSDEATSKANERLDKAATAKALLPDGGSPDRG